MNKTCLPVSCRWRLQEELTHTSCGDMDRDFLGSVLRILCLLRGWPRLTGDIPKPSFVQLAVLQNNEYWGEWLKKIYLNLSGHKNSSQTNWLVNKFDEKNQMDSINSFGFKREED